MPQRKAGGILQGVFTVWKSSNWEKHFHINVLQLLSLKLPIITFTKKLLYLTIHVQIDNKVSLAYLLKMSGARNPQFLKSANQFGIIYCLIRSQLL